MSAFSAVIIEHAVTVDMEDGQPLPPLIVDEAVWHMVRHLPGNRTRWRRIRLADQTIAHSDSAADAP
jgi:hypothetical protein